MRLVVTGSTGGIGGESVRQLRGLGHEVVGLDLRAGEGPEELTCDVRDPEAVRRAVAVAVQRLGGLDVVCNVSGLGLVQDTGEEPGPGALAVLDVNLVGAWRVTAAALPHLLAPGPGGRRGRVVTIASVLSELAIPFAAAYGASKAGVVAWSRSLRLEYGTALDVHTVHPGYVRTAIHDDSVRHGVGLEGLLRADSLEATGRAVVRACTGPRAPRQVTTNALGRALLLAGQHAPTLVDGLTRWSLRRQVRGDAWVEDEMTAGVRQRLG